MLRRLGRIAVCACIAAGAACGDGVTGPIPPPGPSTVVFGGRVVNFDAGGPVGNVRVSLQTVNFSNGRSVTRSSAAGPDGWVIPTDAATSGGDGTFTLPLNLPRSWSGVRLELTGPAGYDDAGQWFSPSTAADRPEIRMYSTLVIRPGESIDVRVTDIAFCGWGAACRRVVVSASPGGPVELEIVPHDSALMGLVETQEDDSSDRRRLMVAPGILPYIVGTGHATLTARR